jgi:hypothetical protein
MLAIGPFPCGAVSANSHRQIGANGATGGQNRSFFVKMSKKEYNETRYLAVFLDLRSNLDRTKQSRSELSFGLRARRAPQTAQFCGILSDPICYVRSGASRLGLQLGRLSLKVSTTKKPTSLEVGPELPLVAELIHEA